MYVKQRMPYAVPLCHQGTDYVFNNANGAAPGCRLLSVTAWPTWSGQRSQLISGWRNGGKCLASSDFQGPGSKRNSPHWLHAAEDQSSPYEHQHHFSLGLDLWPNYCGATKTFWHPPNVPFPSLTNSPYVDLNGRWYTAGAHCKFRLS